MKLTRWFLPEQPDVVALLRGQLAITIEGLDAYVGWADGEEDAAQRLTDAEARGDVAMVPHAMRSAAHLAFAFLRAAEAAREAGDSARAARSVDEALGHPRVAGETTAQAMLFAARIRFAEVSRFSWNQPFDRDFPQMWVKPRKSNVGGFESPCLARA